MFTISFPLIKTLMDEVSYFVWCLIFIWCIFNFTYNFFSWSFFSRNTYRKFFFLKHIKALPGEVRFSLGVLSSVQRFPGVFERKGAIIFPFSSVSDRTRKTFVVLKTHLVLSIHRVSFLNLTFVERSTLT